MKHQLSISQASLKPLEERRWFVVLSLSLAMVLIAGLWTAAGLPIKVSAGTIFIFASVGLSLAVNRLLALIILKVCPSLGILGVAP